MKWDRSLCSEIAIVAVTFSLCAGPAYWVLRSNPIWRARLPRESILPREDARRAALAGFTVIGKKSTLLIAVRSDCPYCRASLPFYRQLGYREHAGQIGWGIVFLTPDASGYFNGRLAGSKIVHNVDFDLIGVKATPTIALVDSIGTVENTWEGMLPESEERALLSRLELQPTSH